MRALLVPVKAFRQAKLRLSAILDNDSRERLARRLAGIVLGASDGLATYVACDDDEVADWAINKGAEVLWTPGLGLSGAVMAGVSHLHNDGVELVVVAHGDLPLVRSFAGFGNENEITLAPDRRLDGTNVAAIPRGVEFEFQYGPGSFTRHRHEAQRRGVIARVVHDWQLACDIDVPADLELLEPALLTALTGMDSPHALDGLPA
jgi:2-phospho-L-lactate guanylyltransferase